jgi:hypothetical protein
LEKLKGEYNDFGTLTSPESLTFLTYNKLRNSVPKSRRIIKDYTVLPSNATDGKSPIKMRKS